MDGCFVVTGFYVKQQFAISKDMNTLMNEARGISAIVIMWLLYKPLLRCLGERGCIIMGLCVNFGYFLGYLLVVSNLTWVFIFTVLGMLGIVNYPSISSVKSQKCSPAEQGQVLGSLSAIQSLSICIGPLIFNNSYALTTNSHGKEWMKHTLGFIVPEKAIWYLGLVITFAAMCVSFTVPDPADIYVPGADENLSITNSEIARRIRLSPDLKGKSEQEVANVVQEALEEQARLRQTTLVRLLAPVLHPAGTASTASLASACSCARVRQRDTGLSVRTACSLTAPHALRRVSVHWLTLMLCNVVCDVCNALLACLLASLLACDRMRRRRWPTIARTRRPPRRLRRRLRGHRQSREPRRVTRSLCTLARQAPAMATIGATPKPNVRTVQRERETVRKHKSQLVPWLVGLDRCPFLMRG
jgi:hypothetical protein